jgi:2-polyprenyl-6-methoxyphenol hydroxylase-like FAD-dependent oxidoreductase
MNGKITIFGYGPVGKATAERLSAQDREITIAQRSKPEALPEGAAFTACDALDPESVLEAARSSAEIVVAIGMPYEGSFGVRPGRRRSAISSPPAGRPGRAWSSSTISTCTGRKPTGSSRPCRSRPPA